MSDAFADSFGTDATVQLAAAGGDASRAEAQADVSRRVAAAYDAHARWLGRLACLLTGDAALAEDLVQEAFTRAFARFAHLRRPDALASYLRRTVVNLAHKRHRRAQTEHAHAERLHAGSALVTQPDVGVREELWEALGALPYRQRAALVLKFYEDTSERGSPARWAAQWGQ